MFVFICRLLIIFERVRKEERTSKNDIEIIRDVIIHLTLLNIPIHFNKLIGPACSVDSVDLLIFRETLLEVIKLVAFY